MKYHVSFILKIVRFFIVKKYSHYCWKKKKTAHVGFSFSCFSHVYHPHPHYYCYHVINLSIRIAVRSSKYYIKLLMINAF